MNYASYEEYVNDIVSMVPSDVDDNFSDILKQYLLPVAEKYWTECLIGQRENYMLTEEDIDQAWNNTTMQIVEMTITKLSDLGLVNTGVNNNGEIVYSISNEGEEYIKNLKDE